MALDTHYLWAGMKARAKARVQKTGSSLKALFEKLRYGAKDPEAWKVKWDAYKNGLKRQTPLVEEKMPDREIHTSYIHD